MSPRCLPAGECPLELGDVGQVNVVSRSMSNDAPSGLLTPPSLWCTHRVRQRKSSGCHTNKIKLRASPASLRSRSDRPFASSANRTDAAAYCHSTEESLTGLKRQ